MRTDKIPWAQTPAAEEGDQVMDFALDKKVG